MDSHGLLTKTGGGLDASRSRFSSKDTVAAELDPYWFRLHIQTNAFRYFWTPFRSTIFQIAWLFLGLTLIADNTAPVALTNRPPVPVAPLEANTPSAVFRKLLRATPEERSAWLEVRPPGTRALVSAKLEEFSKLPVVERELRLEVAELEFFLNPLLKAPLAERQRLLDRIPDSKRAWINLRLEAWDSLSPEARADLLESQQSLAYFVRSEKADPQRLADTLPTVPAPIRSEVEAQFARWTALQPEERARKTALFLRFFDLSTAERAKTIRQLSDEERQRMKDALAQLDALGSQERDRCLQAFRQFTALSPQERADFLANAARWKAMKPAEQTAWHALIDHLDLKAHQGPPLPPVSAMRVTATNQ